MDKKHTWKYPSSFSVFSQFLFLSVTAALPFSHLSSAQGFSLANISNCSLPKSLPLKQKKIPLSLPKNLSLKLPGPPNTPPPAASKPPGDAPPLTNLQTCLHYFSPDDLHIA